MAFYATVLKVLLFAAFGIAAVLIAIVKPFMAIYVGEAFEASWQYVPLLLLSASFSAIASYCGSVYSALYKSVNGMISTLVSALVCVATGWILIPIWGIWGAVVSLVSSYVCLALYRLIDINRYVRIGYGGRHLIVNAILVLVEAICVSFEWFALPVSLCTLALFLLNNLDLLKRLVRRDKA